MKDASPHLTKSINDLFRRKKASFVKQGQAGKINLLKINNAYDRFLIRTERAELLPTDTTNTNKSTNDTYFDNTIETNSEDMPSSTDKHE
ncbi:hypothetical protein [Cerasicoccus maritimus]|uniref:hypothetical protein n=1 Tax=Cerasicoccus maritimus TaxID=490089 RepID=UPI002852750D|nr:hypothetical protein [Cerasicoccus maritimus]